MCLCCRGKRDAKSSQLSPSPGLGPSMKKKTRHSSASPCPTLKRPRSRSYDTAQVSSSQAKSDLPSSSRNSGTSVPQRRVSTAVKKKTSRITLHKRFTLDDQEPFELEENVTIAILRKADAQPSEDVTVKVIYLSLLSSLTFSQAMLASLPDWTPAGAGVGDLLHKVTPACTQYLFLRQGTPENAPDMAVSILR